MSEPSDSAAGKNATSAPRDSAAKESFDALPHVDSPSISPAGGDLTTDQAADAGPAPGTIASSKDKPEATAAEANAAAAETAPASKIVVFPRIRVPAMNLSRRARRTAVHAAAIAAAAGIGAVVGAITMAGLATTDGNRISSSVADRRALQESVARLDAEVSALRAGRDGAIQSVRTQTGRAAASNDKTGPATEKPNDTLVTGAIGEASAAVSGTIAAATAATVTAPLPQPRPPLVQGWSIYRSPDGLVFVEQRGGDLYLISPGMPLPGLGRVEAINRDGGRIEVVTTGGIITSSPGRTVRVRSERMPPFFERY